jgi:hypothetical protein
MRDFAYDAGRQGGLSLWGGVQEGQVAEVLDVFEVGVAGQIADAAVEVESELGVDLDGEPAAGDLGQAPE